VATLLGGELGWTAPDQAAAVETYLAEAHREYDVPGPEPVPAPAPAIAEPAAAATGAG